jgi:hypothetical protein
VQTKWEDVSGKGSDHLTVPGGDPSRQNTVLILSIMECTTTNS